MIEWYIPWDLIDRGLKLQLLIWLAAILGSYWICWRSVVRKKPWLRSLRRKQEREARKLRDSQ